MIYWTTGTVTDKESSEQGLRELESHESIRDVLVQRSCRESTAPLAVCSMVLIHQTRDWCGCGVTAIADTDALRSKCTNCALILFL